MKTRQDYLSGKISHDEYYIQFVDSHIVNQVLFIIGKDEILNSKDKHFNDIPLKYWNIVLCPLPDYVKNQLKQAGDNTTLAGAICIAKQAAKQIRDGKIKF